MILNGVMALILRYFTEFGSFRRALRISGWRCRKISTFGISSPDEFLLLMKRISNWQFPVKDYKMSNPGQIQHAGNSRTGSWNKGLSWKVWSNLEILLDRCFPQQHLFTGRRKIWHATVNLWWALPRKLLLWSVHPVAQHGRPETANWTIATHLVKLLLTLCGLASRDSTTRPRAKRTSPWKSPS